MRFERLHALLAAALLATAPAAAAQLQFEPDKATVEALTEIARDNLTRARLSDGSNVPPETAEERSRPIIPPALAEQTIRRGFLAGEMNSCGLDYNEQSYIPYMRALRASGRYSDRQLAFIGLLHGVSQGFVENSLARDARSCSLDAVVQLQRMASESPILTP